MELVGGWFGHTGEVVVGGRLVGIGDWIGQLGKLAVGGWFDQLGGAAGGFQVGTTPVVVGWDGPEPIIAGRPIVCLKAGVELTGGPDNLAADGGLTKGLGSAVIDADNGLGSPPGLRKSGRIEGTDRMRGS